MILYPKGEVTMQTMVFLVRARLDGFCLTAHIRDVSRAGSPPQGQQRYGPPSQGANQQMFFQYSQCIWTKKALCVCFPKVIYQRRGRSLSSIKLA